MPGEVLATYLRDGRTTAILRVNELIVEVVLKPEFDAAGEPRRWHFWIRTDGDSHPSEQAALFAAMQDVARLSRVQRVAVVQLRTVETLNAC
jgi:hypothetical protein